MGQRGLAGKDRMHRPREGPRGHLFPLGQGSLHPTPSGDENGAGFLKQSFLAWGWRTNTMSIKTSHITSPVSPCRFRELS